MPDQYNVHQTETIWSRYVKAIDSCYPPPSHPPPLCLIRIATISHGSVQLRRHAMETHHTAKCHIILHLRSIGNLFTQMTLDLSMSQCRITMLYIQNDNTHSHTCSWYLSESMGARKCCGGNTMTGLELMGRAIRLARYMSFSQ